MQWDQTGSHSCCAAVLLCCGSWAALEHGQCSVTAGCRPEEDQLFPESVAGQGCWGPMGDLGTHSLAAGACLGPGVTVQLEYSDSYGRVVDGEWKKTEEL